MPGLASTAELMAKNWRCWFSADTGANAPRSSVYSDASICDDVAVQVKTVDAVQGREADVVIFSVTRSNLTGELGFLADRYQGRVNVALSRARELLWMVGDSEFCSSREGPLKRVLSHITSTAGGRVQYL
ncbi:C-terminal helicase domain-containing protein [Yinghuangia aomiensis]